MAWPWLQTSMISISPKSIGPDSMLASKPELCMTDSSVDRVKLEILGAARLARKRARGRERDARRRERRRAAKAIPTLELLGCSPDPAWLASVARAQTQIRTAAACMSTALRAIGGLAAPISRRNAKVALDAIGHARAAVDALMPVSVCPVCRAADPACQHCAGLGALTLAQASALSPDWLHDSE